MPVKMCKNRTEKIQNKQFSRGAALCNKRAFSLPLYVSLFSIAIKCPVEVQWWVDNVHQNLYRFIISSIIAFIYHVNENMLKYK